MGEKTNDELKRAFEFEKKDKLFFRLRRKKTREELSHSGPILYHHRHHNQLHQTAPIDLLSPIETSKKNKRELRKNVKGRSIAFFFSKTTRTRKDKASQNNHFFSYLLVVKPEEEEADEIEIDALCANIFVYAFVCVCVSSSASE
jgi:hypothetical protein